MTDFQYNDLEGAPDLRDDALRNLQCNILRSTQRIACDHVFHRFKTKQAMLNWLKTAPTPSAADATDPRLVNVLFTYDGLHRLGLPEDLLNQMDPVFRRGSRPRAVELLGDPPPTSWEKAHYLPWHVVELHWRIASEDPVKVSGSTTEHVVVVERGNAIGADGQPLRQDDAPRYNHYGIADVNSNPAYTRRDYEAQLEMRTPSPDARWKWDPRAKLSTLLVPDPLASHGGCFGSYFVFRKFDQDLDGFREKLKNIVKVLLEKKDSWQWKQYRALVALTTDDLLQLLAALSSSEPLHAALSNKAGIVLTQLIFGVGPSGERPTGGTDNNFDYSRDPGGNACPFSAHARVCNARGSRLAPQLEHKTVIARHGISHARGTFFWCAQASIGEQFEYIQQKWANRSNANPDHHPVPGVDYLIGRGGPPESGLSLEVRDTIKLRAAEYLFAPSLMGFQRLRAMGGVQ